MLTLLEDPEWGQWSDREIARRTNVHGVTVGRIRAGLSADLQQIADRKVERGGTTYVQRTKNIGRAAPKRDAILAIIRETPGLTDERAAERAGAS